MGNGAILGAQFNGTLTITDDDPAPTLSFSYPLFTVAENEPSTSIFVSRSSNNAGTISVNYSISAGSATADNDYRYVSGTLTWADGEGGDKSFIIPLLDDTLYEGDETVQLTLSSPMGAILQNPTEATLNITDNETPPRSGGGGALGWLFLLLGYLPRTKIDVRGWHHRRC